jgi:dTDP-4-amino-4,6-dideoxygalactose transaminase
LRQDIIQIVRPFYPPRKEFEKYLDQIYKNGWLTNNGPLVRELEYELKKHFEINDISVVSSGTLALQLVLELIPEKGEIITTPFSFIATSSAIKWQGHEVVYADIDPKTWNIDPSTIEPLINQNSRAIVATHVFGNPCKIEKLEELASKHNLILIFDAAHAFGVKFKNQSILKFGHYTCLSFHATKLFHTVEGGAIHSNRGDHLKIQQMKNFGFEAPYAIGRLGINAKMSELHAAIGLLNLNYLASNLNKVSILYELYMDGIKGLGGVTFQKINENGSLNYAYFPVLFESEEVCIKILSELEADGIFARRYFYPALSNLDFLNTTSTPIADDISKRILCLPLYVDMSKKDVERVVKSISKSLV